MAGFLISLYFIEKSGNNSVKISNTFSYHHPKTTIRLEKIETQLNKIEEKHQISGITGKVQFDEIRKMIN
jgi:hypothetical protein